METKNRMRSLFNYFSIKSCLIIIIMSISFLPLSLAHSQGLPKDPLGKPDLWKQLIAHPKNDKLWSDYFGKDLFELTKEEGMQFRTWRSQLIAALDAPVNKTPNFDEDATLNQLTNNISKNFMLIEDYFSSEFKRLGSSYTTFSEKYPNGNYNKVVWVEEHELQLKNLKSGK